ncbi:hypothetical protein ANN_14370 [Periplaneta americana]|uniref:Uncharacterized protein n=1 Tax=Periplaneta americana TaxID=6978 RepID=A0ABQ8SXJ3_PERAM|nr:hypothetical protein ANN_14370 [Periplaneta americana]
MIMSRDQNIVRNGNIKIGDLSYKEVEKFKYLGATVTNINDTWEEIKRRINMGNVCYYSVEKPLSSSLLSKVVKVRIYKTVLLPVVLYGCETWTLTLREEQTSRAFENKSHRCSSVDRLAGLLIRSCVRAWVGSPFGLIEWFLPRFSPAVGLKPDGLWRVLDINPFDLITCWLFNDAVSTTRLFSVDEIGVSEMIFGEMRPRIRHRLPCIHITDGENLGKTQPVSVLCDCVQATQLIPNLTGPVASLASRCNENKEQNCWMNRCCHGDCQNQSRTHRHDTTVHDVIRLLIPALYKNQSDSLMAADGDCHHLCKLMAPVRHRWSINDVIGGIRNTVMPSDCSPPPATALPADYSRFVRLRTRIGVNQSQSPLPLADTEQLRTVTTQVETANRQMIASSIIEDNHNIETVERTLM